VLIVSLVLAVIGLAALVFAVITSNELVAWVCIGASVLGVILLIIDALQERQRRVAGPAAGPTEDAPTEDAESHDDDAAADHPAEPLDESDDARPADADIEDSVSGEH
jgi:hypothetical protein